MLVRFRLGLGSRTKTVAIGYAPVLQALAEGVPGDVGQPGMAHIAVVLGLLFCSLLVETVE